MRPHAVFSNLTRGVNSDATAHKKNWAPALQSTDLVKVETMG